MNSVNKYSNRIYTMGVLFIFCTAPCIASYEEEEQDKEIAQILCDMKNSVPQEAPVYSRPKQTHKRKQSSTPEPGHLVAKHLKHHSGPKSVFIINQNLIKAAPNDEVMCNWCGEEVTLSEYAQHVYDYHENIITKAGIMIEDNRHQAKVICGHCQYLCKKEALKNHIWGNHSKQMATGLRRYIN